MSKTYSYRTSGNQEPRLSNRRRSDSRRKLNQQLRHNVVMDDYEADVWRG